MTAVTGIDLLDIFGLSDAEADRRIKGEKTEGIIDNFMNRAVGNLQGDLFSAAETINDNWASTVQDSIDEIHEGLRTLAELSKPMLEDARTYEGIFIYTRPGDNFRLRWGSMAKSYHQTFVSMAGDLDRLSNAWRGVGSNNDALEVLEALRLSVEALRGVMKSIRRSALKREWDAEKDDPNFEVHADDDASWKTPDYASIIEAPFVERFNDLVSYVDGNDILAKS